MWHILLFSSKTEISQDQVYLLYICYMLYVSDRTVNVYVCGRCKMHRLRKRLLMCFQLGADVSLVRSVEWRAVTGEHQSGESVCTTAGASHGHIPQPHHQKTLLEGKMLLDALKTLKERFIQKCKFLSYLLLSLLTFILSW